MSTTLKDDVIAFIGKEYRKKARACHPDHNTQDDSAFVELTQQRDEILHALNGGSSSTLRLQTGDNTNESPSTSTRIYNMRYINHQSSLSVFVQFIQFFLLGLCRLCRFISSHLMITIFFITILLVLFLISTSSSSTFKDPSTNLFKFTRTDLHRNRLEVVVDGRILQIFVTDINYKLYKNSHQVFIKELKRIIKQ
ncbi:hypothetical protein P9112_007973 [Eukaryota sp. TZLM1-RC]